MIEEGFINEEISKKIIQNYLNNPILKNINIEIFIFLEIFENSFFFEIMIFDFRRNFDKNRKKR